ncbi:CDP-diacylglycerol--glycerol-3-phosphate 3-phosphatidyltransferase, partial [Aeromicrobium sp. PE09-221]|uniref:CDP-alcohol phosphatidyltransferase family protein n=1 Tax=Aeromicrobium sp. PE09-221 TaxID=1898043 RepID=UPI000B6C5970
MTERSSERIFTVPNLLSFVRIALVPVFLWLVLGPQWDVAALAVLVVSGITDYLDGKIALSLEPTSRMKAILDPVSARVYMLAAVVGLGPRAILPCRLATTLPLCHVLPFSLIPFLRTRGYSSLPGHFLAHAAP